MIFSRIVYSAILAGTLAGILLTSLQAASLEPIILAAEHYEIGAGGAHGDNHSGEQATRAGARDLPRMALSLLANLLACTGYAAVTLALMCLLWLPRKRNLSWSQGSLWGLAGFAVLFLAPALGLPPEIPGAEAAAIVQRQAWWLLCVASVAAGLGVLAFAGTRLKALGLPLLALPYVVGAPGIDAPMFSHTDPSIVDTLDSLHQQFVFASAITNLVVWLVLGLACRYAFNRWLRPAAQREDPGAADSRPDS